MPKRTSTKIPKNAMIVDNYEEFHREIEAFGHSERNLLIVVGPPGTAKTTAVRNRVQQARVIQGGSTPYKLYIELYENRNRPIVLDDADKIFQNKDGVFLLKLLTQTEKVKTIQWNSNTAEIRKGELKSEFTTTSSTLIVANSWPQKNVDIDAIESRGHLIYFMPSSLEMHKFARPFVADNEIYEFIGSNLKLFDCFDLRFYGKAKDIKATGLRTGNNDLWKEHLRRLMLSTEKRTALTLMSNLNFASDNQRAKQFESLTGFSHRTFYRYKNEILLHQGKAG